MLTYCLKCKKKKKKKRKNRDCLFKSFRNFRQYTIFIIKMCQNVLYVLVKSEETRSKRIVKQFNF